MKLGIEREKIGDILVHENGADILVCSDISESLSHLLSTLTRFSKASINIIETKALPPHKIKKEEIKIIIPSLRLDSIVSELAHASRNRAIDLLNSERVLVNFEIQTKASKLLNINDIVTIRGKGKFIISNITGTTRNGNLVVLVSKYV